MHYSVEKVKSIIIVILVCIIVFGGSFVSSELSYYKYHCDVEDNANNSSSSVFEDIDIDRYLSLLSFSKLSLIYIGQSDCQYSNAQDIVFETLKDSYDFDVYYLNLDNLDEDSISLLYNSYDSFMNDGLSTPTMMLVQNGEVKAFKKGYTSYDNMILFLEENNFILE